MTMPSTTDAAERLLSFLSTGIRSGVEIQQRLKCSQPTVSRLLAQVSGRVVTIGRARARRYARLRDVQGLGSEFPVYRIDSDGNAHTVGALIAVALDEFLWRPAVGSEQVFRSLPWFLADLYPDGFVGRAFVRRLHLELGLPPRGIDWRDDHVLIALARRGEDTMGNLVVGRESIERYFSMVRAPNEAIGSDAIAETYARLATEAMNGQPSGSSAGGEQPKFTAVIERDGALQNVLVKFSPPINTDAGLRWADLLICEDHALRIIREIAAIPSAQSRIVEAGERVFLETVRFDRIGPIGRLPIISLRAVDSEFHGFQDTWSNAANRLAADSRLSPTDASAMRWLSVFGNLIGNNDQHFGNISLVMVDGSKLFTLAPAYDMLPMIYRPADGAAHASPIDPTPASPGAPEEWLAALKCAVLFWERAGEDPRISSGFRQLCLANRSVVQRLLDGPRLLA